MPLVRVPEPFQHPDWLRAEVRGFRAPIAVVLKTARLGFQDDYLSPT
jgi:hypothetical protein